MGCHACLKRIGNLRDEVCLHHQEPAPVIPSLQLRALNDPYQQTMEESSCSSMANQHSSGTANWSPFNQSQHSPSHLVPWGAWALGNHNTPMRERENGIDWLLHDWWEWFKMRKFRRWDQYCKRGSWVLLSKLCQRLHSIHTKGWKVQQ